MRTKLLPALSLALACLVGVLASAQDTKPVAKDPPVLGLRWSEPRPGSLIVSEVESNSPAARTGIAKGDVVLAVGGEEIESGAGLTKLLRAIGPGAKVTLQYRRGTQTRERELIGPEARIGMFGAFVQLDTGDRLKVMEVSPNTPAEKSGLKVGDTIVTVAGHKPVSAPELAAFMSRLVTTAKTVEPIAIKVERPGKDQAMMIVIDRDTSGDAPSPQAPVEAVVVTARTSVLGIAVQEQGDRVVVTQIIPREPAAKAGIQPGDAILAIGKQKVDSYAALAAAIKPFKPGDEVPLEVLRGDKAGTIAVQVMTTKSAGADVMLDSSGDINAIVNEVQSLQARVNKLEQIVAEMQLQVGRSR